VSHDLLDLEERTLFARLAIVAVGFSMAAAFGVTGMPAVGYDAGGFAGSALAIDDAVG